MKVTSKSILIARKKCEGNEELPYCVEIKFFDINNPHMTAELPKKELEFRDAESVQINLPVAYFVMGNDLVINDAGTVIVEQKKKTVFLQKA
ncbi:hypothetical protein HY639_05225 [Candidatus Woesearchaeota archaeon]|nr:hypothetical protein [Candidatus Woesearchaeota archaeon]